MSRSVLLAAIGMLCLLAATPASAQEGGGGILPPGDEPPPPSDGPFCGSEDSVTGEACRDEVACEAIHGNPDCAGQDLGVCTGDEGVPGTSPGSTTLQCSIPQPIPDAPEGFVLIDITEVACTAIPPPPDLATAPLPAPRIGASPPGLDDHRGLAGLESWLWAEGETIAHWPVTGVGEEGRDLTFQPVTLDEDGVPQPSGDPTTTEQRWPCIAQTIHTATIVSWAWELDGPTRTHTHTSDESGERPDLDSDGSVAAWRVDPQHAGTHTLTLTTTWEGHWPGAPHAEGPASTLDYHVTDWTTQLELP